MVYFTHQIPSPVAGMLFQTGDNAIVIKPETSGFKDYEIIISNIEISIAVDDSGVFIDSGQVGSCSCIFIVVCNKGLQEKGYTTVERQEMRGPYKSIFLM